MKSLRFLQSKRSYIVLCVIGIVMNGFSQGSTITFNVDGATTIVNKEIFGLLMERLGRQWDGSGSINVGSSTSIKNINGMRQDVIDGFVECGIGAAEWPGGCAGNGYDWGSKKTSTSEIGVDRFIQFCKLTGAEAVIAGKPSSSDAASNLAFAKYIINDLNYPLKWFKIGNEIWGGCGTNYTSGYTSTFTANFDKLKDLRSTDNGKDLKIIAAAGASEGSYNWISTYYSSIGSSMDAIEFHDYIYHPDNISSSNPTTANYWQVMSEVLSGDFHSHLNTILSSMNSSDASKRVKIDMDEWGDWLQDLGDNWMQQITVMDAVSAGAHLNQFIPNADRVGVCCLAQGINVIHSVININTSGTMVKTPTFYVFKMYKPHHTNNAKFAPITASKFENANGSTPAGNAAASVDAGGYVNVSITNTDISATRQVAVTLTSSHAAYKVTSAEVVTGANINSTNDFGQAEQVNIKTLEASAYSINGKTLTVTMPTKSVVMIRLLPTDVAVEPGSMQSNIAEAFSIKAGSRGAVVITSSVRRAEPIAISLHRIDGRTLADGISQTLQAGKSSLVLGRDIGKGVYIVKIAGEGINLSKRIVVAR
jgi:alpha-L-arabinofuranosidase